jgi:hypothetical protein
MNAVKGATRAPIQIEQDHIFPIVIRAELVTITSTERRNQCRGAVYSHILYWIAKKMMQGEKYWWNTEQKITEELNRNWSKNTIGRAIQGIIDLGILGRKHNPADGTDRTYYYYFDKTHLRALKKRCKELKIDLNNIDLPPELVWLLQASSPKAQNDLCKRPSRTLAKIQDAPFQESKKGTCYIRNTQVSTQNSTQVSTQREEKAPISQDQTVSLSQGASNKFSSEEETSQPTEETLREKVSLSGTETRQPALPPTKEMPRQSENDSYSQKNTARLSVVQSIELSPAEMAETYSRFDHAWKNACTQVKIPIAPGYMVPRNYWNDIAMQDLHNMGMTVEDLTLILVKKMQDERVRKELRPSIIAKNYMIWQLDIQLCPSSSQQDEYKNASGNDLLEELRGNTKSEVICG